jgi:hypothetical protein
MADTTFHGLDDFRAQLEAAGWRIGRDSLKAAGNVCNWYAWKRGGIDGPDCECNDKPPSLMVWPHLFDGAWADAHNVKNTGSVTLEICGERGGQWLKFHVYSLTPAVFFDRLALASAQLTAAWRAAAEVTAEEV